MNQANDCGPLFSIWSRMIWINAGFPPGVFNVQRSMLNAQRSTVRLDELLSVGRWALSVERLPPTLDELIRCVVSETDQHIPQTAAGLSLPAAMVFKAMVLHSRRDSSGGGAFFNGLYFQRRVRSQSAGQHVRPEQARSNGTGQCYPRSQRKNLWPNLRREPRDSPVREVGSRSDYRPHCRVGRKLL